MGCYHFLINNVTIYIYVYNFFMYPRVTLGYFSRSQRLGQRIYAFIILIDITNFPSLRVITIYIPTNNVWNWLFLQPHKHTMSQGWIFDNLIGKTVSQCRFYISFHLWVVSYINKNNLFFLVYTLPILIEFYQKLGALYIWVISNFSWYLLQVF